MIPRDTGFPSMFRRVKNMPSVNPRASSVPLSTLSRKCFMIILSRNRWRNQTNKLGLVNIWVLFQPETKAQQRHWGHWRCQLTPSSDAWAPIALRFDEIKQAPLNVQVVSDGFFHTRYFGRMVLSFKET